MGVRVEVSTSGVDDALQGLSSDPFGARLPQATGLRIPSLRQDDTTRYLFLLATRTICAPTRIRGLRQLLTIGAAGLVAEAFVPAQEFEVVTPSFQAWDGNVSWHLVMEPNERPSPSIPINRGGVEAVNFAYQYADSPALIFQTAAFGGGQTDYYFNSLTAYTPPSTLDWQPLGGLGNMHDIRFPWANDHAWDSLDIPICPTTNRRVSLYASVLQTSGLQTPNTTNPSSRGAIWSPETAFAEMLDAADFNACIFWRIAGAIIFEDGDCGCGDRHHAGI